MVFVKVRETYDLHTVRNKMTVIGIHTPKPDIIKKNFPGLLMQCRAYRPVSCDIRLACASVLPLDPKGVGLAEGDVAPEDVFNPILYKAMSNKGMSQLEARINLLRSDIDATLDVDGPSAFAEVDDVQSALTDEFPIYYGLLSDAHGWKHAMPQSGLTMTGLRPIVHEIVSTVGDIKNGNPLSGLKYTGPNAAGAVTETSPFCMIGGSKPMPFINCTAYSRATNGSDGVAEPGFKPNEPLQCEQTIPYVPVMVGAVIVPPSKLHELFYRMVCEWTIEFSAIRPLGEITNWAGLAAIGNATHFQNYDYSATKLAVTGSDESILESDSCMVSANVDVTKVM